MSSDRVLHLFERLGALLRSELRRKAANQGLEPVHVLALWYISRANQFSDNPLAVGDFLGLSKGNMSQRLNVLERKGLLRKQVNNDDRRRVHLALTQAGKVCLSRLYPPKSWPVETSPTLGNALETALRVLIDANGAKSFGICRSCRFHETRRRQAFCGLLQIPLSATQSRQLCQEHEYPQVCL
jgi:DNA-binding MarR family transcriptional regulator